MKKIFAGILTAMLMLGVTSCGSSDESADSAVQNNGQNTSSSEAASSPESTQNPNTSAGGSKTLVVVYSASGNTKAIADYIVSATGADLFEITPTEPYTSDDLDWTDPDSRVSREHDDESLRDVELTTTTVENWEDYDTVFIGYPIWWGILLFLYPFGGE